MKDLLSLDLNSSLTSIPFTNLSLLNIPKNECYVNFGMCGLQLIQKNLLVNNTIEMEYSDLTGMTSSFSIALKSQGSVLEEQFHNQNLGVTWPNNKPRRRENQKVQEQRKKRSNIVLSSCFEPGTELEHVSALIWFQNYQKDSCFNPSFTVLQLKQVNNLSRITQQVIGRAWVLTTFFQISMSVLYPFHRGNRFIFTDSKISLRKSYSPCNMGFFCSLFHSLIFMFHEFLNP